MTQISDKLGPMDTDITSAEFERTGDRVVSVSVNYSSKMSRNFQSADCAVGVTMRLSETSDPLAVAQEWQDKLRTFVHRECRKGLGEFA